MSLPQQSPINLSNHVLAEFGKNKLAIKWKKSAIGTIKKDGHGVHVEFACDERQYIELDQKRFHLAQFHFHHPSEHWVAGSQQTMELHVVHQNVDDGSRAVLGIFIEPAVKAKTAPGLVEQMNRYFSLKNERPDPSISSNPLDWLPDDVSHYYRYEGSLTTPDYDENVSWVVLREPLKVAKDELMKLVPYLKHPARSPQPLNRRFILASFR